jgi:hypothetical protein
MLFPSSKVDVVTPPAIFSGASLYIMIPPEEPETLDFSVNATRLSAVPFVINLILNSKWTLKKHYTKKKSFGNIPKDLTLNFVFRNFLK